MSDDPANSSPAAAGTLPPGTLLDHYRLERGGAVRTFAGLPPEEVR